MEIALKVFVRKFVVGYALVFSSAIYAHSVDSLLLVAKTKAEAGDFKSAAMAYQQVLQIDDTHSEARLGLSTALMNAQIQEPYSEESEALSAIFSSD